MLPPAFGLRYPGLLGSMGHCLSHCLQNTPGLAGKAGVLGSFPSPCCKQPTLFCPGLSWQLDGASGLIFCALAGLGSDLWWPL